MIKYTEHGDVDIRCIEYSEPWDGIYLHKEVGFYFGAGDEIGRVWDDEKNRYRFFCNSFEVHGSKIKVARKIFLNNRRT